jgi:4-amino-4-deoxy-L-arabinose transferase-like glycosyltransferase
MDRWRVIVLMLLFTFWSIELINLDRHPPLHEDEAWILSPGYKLATRGEFGSDLFTGFYGMEQHYLEFPPLMSIVPGVGTRVFGLSVWSMRYLPVAFGILTIAHRDFRRSIFTARSRRGLLGLSESTRCAVSGNADRQRRQSHGSISIESVRRLKS